MLFFTVYNHNYNFLIGESVLSFFREYKLAPIIEKIDQIINPNSKYITHLNGCSLKANSDLVIYQDIAFKIETGRQLKLGTVFQAEEIVLTKKAVPRIKLKSGYVTANKKFITLTQEPITKRTMMLDGKLQFVRDDIENYIYDIADQPIKALTDLKIYKDLAFKNVTEEQIKQGRVFKPEAIEFSKGGTPRFKLKKGYATTNKKFVALTDEPVTKSSIVVNGKVQFVRDDIENYIYNIENQCVKAITDIKIYKDLAFKILIEDKIKQGVVFKPEAIEFSKGGTPRFKINKGFVTTNKKFVALTSEQVSKPTILINGLQQTVRADIENYIYDLKDQSVKALTDIKIYEDLAFKELTEDQIKKGIVFKPEAIEFSKGGTPRFKIKKGYATTNKKFVTLTNEPVTKPIIMIHGQEHVVREDIENYIYDIAEQYVEALTDIKIYEDLAFKNLVNDQIKQGIVFKPEAIEFSKGGTPRFKLKNGYTTTNKKFVTLTNKPQIQMLTEVTKENHSTIQIDLEKYIIDLNNSNVKALDHIKIYKDIDFNEWSERTIGLGDIFSAQRIEYTKAGKPRIKVNGGYVSAHKKNIQLTQDTPLVSLVIPIYNVEKYLEECLDSLYKQSYQNIEIILVNDGSPDNSILIAEKFVELDKRFILHTQVNAGLSAARNKGIELSTGQFIWFIDSDDIIPENAVKVMVENLLQSGSDFAVGCYRRFNSTGFKKPAHWISDLHAKTIKNTNLHDSSDVLVNAIACSKVINYNYLMKNNLFFEVGILYEDQLWSAKLFSNSKSFDVVKDVIYEWRVREDNSSITQQAFEVNNLSAILNAVKTSVDEFYRLGLDEIAHNRIVQFLSNNMREYISFLDKTEKDYFDELANGLIYLTEKLPLFKWKKVPAHIASVEWLILQKNYEKVLFSIQQGVRNIYTMVAIEKDGHLILKVPYWNDPSVNFPNEVLEIKENQYKPNVELRKAEWLDDKRLSIEGWAFLSLINPEDVVNPVSVTLISADKKYKKSLVVNNFDHPQLDRISPHHINDYRKFGFNTIIDIDDLEKISSQEYNFEFNFCVGKVERTMILNKLASWCSAGNLKTHTTNSGVNVRLFKGKNSLVTLGLSKKNVFLKDYSIKDNYIFLNISSENKLKNLEIKFMDKNKKELVCLKYNNILSNSDYYCFKLDVKEIINIDAKHWLVRANDINDRSLTIDANNNFDKPFVLVKNKENISLYATEYGNLGLVSIPPTIYVEDVEHTKMGIKISGILLGSDNKNITAIIKDHRYAIDCKVNKKRGNGFSLTIPYSFKNWGDIHYLASGKYKLQILNEDKNISILLSENISAQLPLWMSKKPPVVCRLEYELKNKFFVLTVDPSILLEDQGVRNRVLNIAKHESSNEIVDEKIVFFRTYYGESTTCCALGIHHELLKRNRSDLKLVWSVKDTSIGVPEGGISVVEGSKEWYELFSKAKYIITNTHQPDFFKKKAGQVVVATFHGYPFKLAGLPFWQSSGISKNQIQSFMDRHNQWDYLVSPAPYATPILNDVFPSSTAKTIEIGYPRNDVLFSNEKDNIRTRVRKKLGISKQKKVVLYAPTFRDNMAVNDHHAEMVKYLDLNELVSHFDDNFIVLVRGHAFNARSSERVSVVDERIIDVTDYPEITDLCIASDTAILDYSSLRFDYTLTNNPMIFFVPDLDEYIHDIRGSLVPYEETAPGPLVKTQDELVYWLKNLDQLDTEFKPARKLFIENYMPLEDGKASERFVDIVFSN